MQSIHSSNFHMVSELSEFFLDIFSLSPWKFVSKFVGPSMATTSGSVITIDESHPFFLHYGENSGAILVAQPLVNDNYPTWAKSMQRALGAKSKLGFIDGILSLTPTMAKVPLLIQAWTKSNNMVVSWMSNCVSPKILVSVVYKNTALEVWNNLKVISSQTNGSRLFPLQKDLATISQGNLSIT